MSLAVWVYPESEDFFIFNSDGLPVPASISLQKQRRYLPCLDWIKPRYLELRLMNSGPAVTSIKWWSHEVLSYDLSNKEVQFFINGKLDAFSSFAGNLPFPLTDGFRLGPTDNDQATSMLGKMDDFRIYGTVLSNQEVEKLYGAGSGDFNQKTIQITSSGEFAIPRIVEVYFLDDGLPIETSSNSGDAFEIGDISAPGSNISNLVKLGTGHFQFELTPLDLTSSQSLLVSIDGSQVKSASFSESFEDANHTVVYDPQLPVFSSLLSLTGRAGLFLHSQYMLNILQCSMSLHFHRVSNLIQLPILYWEFLKRGEIFK